jgi:hypothetical protein
VIQGNNLTLNIPGEDGRIHPRTFRRGGVREYNQLLGRLKAHIETLNRAFFAEQERLRNRAAVEELYREYHAIVYSLYRGHLVLRESLATLQRRVDALKPVIAEMQEEYQAMQAYYAETKDLVTTPLSCQTRNVEIRSRIYVSLSSLLRVSLHSVLNVTLHSDLTRIRWVSEEFTTRFREQQQRIQDMTEVAAELRKAAQRYPPGQQVAQQVNQEAMSISQEFPDLLEKLSSQATLSLAQAKEQEKAAQSIYDRGEELLEKAKAWFAGLKCQD